MNLLFIHLVMVEWNGIVWIVNWQCLGKIYNQSINLNDFIMLQKTTVGTSLVYRTQITENLKQTESLNSVQRDD
jgi:hypothetical protein